MNSKAGKNHIISGNRISQHHYLEMPWNPDEIFSQRLPVQEKTKASESGRLVQIEAFGINFGSVFLISPW